MDEWLRSNAHWVTFAGTVVGILGTAFGVYNWMAKRRLQWLKDASLGALNNMTRGLGSRWDRVDRDGAIATTTVKYESDQIRKRFLDVLFGSLQPSAYDLEKLLGTGRINQDDKDYLDSLRIRD